jgi:hypothetical protein
MGGQLFIPLPLQIYYIKCSVVMTTYKLLIYKEKNPIEDNSLYLQIYYIKCSVVMTTNKLSDIKKIQLYSPTYFVLGFDYLNSLNLPFLHFLH